MIKLKALLPEVWDANLLEQSESFIIFCDMDGVMCDFDLQFTQMIGSSPKEFESQYGTLKFWNEIANKGELFWSSMEKMPDFTQLKDGIVKIVNDNNLDLQVLTSTSGNWIIKNHPRDEAKEVIRNIEKGKLEWLRNNWSGLKVNFSGSGGSKAKFAKSNSCLIDDLSKNIESFEAAGGKGIIHTTASKSLNDLQLLINQLPESFGYSYSNI
jgi:hypothetical protein